MKLKIKRPKISMLLFAMLTLIFCFIANTKINAQIEPEENIRTEFTECGTDLRIEQIDYNNQTRQRKENLRIAISNGPKYIPLTIHIVRTSSRLDGLTEEELIQSINEVNQNFEQVNFIFEVCSINYIDDDKFFYLDMWGTYDDQSLEYQMAKPNLVEGSINVFFKPNITKYCGWSSFPGFLNIEAPKDWIVMNNNCYLGTLAHEIGHYFNLYHPHQGPWKKGEVEIVATELVSRDPEIGNCGKPMVGDELCDTPAEPVRNNKGISGCVNESCEYTCIETDENGDIFCELPCVQQDINGDTYMPNTNNIMSYTQKSCRESFTPGQIERMRVSLMDDRSYLNVNDSKSCVEIGNLFQPCGERDLLALTALYDATSGESWTTPWDLTRPIEEWTGVTLENGCVTGLNLSSKNLTGNIPAEIGNLADLKLLKLNGNNLSGFIPAEISYLNNLTQLDLQDNNLSGYIPKSIQYLKQLKYLFLQDNSLEGEIPEEITRLSSLVRVPFVYNNKLSGCYKPNLIELCSKSFSENKYISSENNFSSTWEEFCNSDLGKCTNGSRMTDSLALISIYNALNGPEWVYIDWPITGAPIDCWTGVRLNNEGRVISLKIGKESSINSSLPPEIGNLNYLQTLVLSKNGIIAPLPSEMGNLSNLSSVTIESINFEGSSFPNVICNITNLKSLYIRYSGLVGEIPACLGNLENLEVFDIVRNNFVGNLPGELTNLDKLIEISICSSTLGGCFDPAFKKWCSWALEHPNCISTNEDWVTTSFDATFEEFCTSDKGMCDVICPPDLDDSGTITQGTYEVSNYIKSAGIIGDNQNVIYDAGGYIELNKGFKADSKKSVVFLAKIEGCAPQLKEGSLIEQTTFIKNFPNPFTGETTIEFEINEDTNVSLFISDITGKQIATLLNNEVSNKGTNQIVFNGQNLAQGIYYCTLISDNKVSTQKMMLMK